MFWHLRMIWHTKNNLCNLQKFWELRRPPPAPLWEKFPKNPVFFGGGVPYSKIQISITTLIEHRIYKDLSYQTSLRVDVAKHCTVLPTPLPMEVKQEARRCHGFLGLAVSNISPQEWVSHTCTLRIVAWNSL